MFEMVMSPGDANNLPSIRFDLADHPATVHVYLCANLGQVAILECA
jgi:hypothetical protein